MVTDAVGVLKKKQFKLSTITIHRQPFTTIVERCSLLEALNKRKSLDWDEKTWLP